LAEAIAGFRRDLAARQLRRSTLRGYRVTLRQFAEFAASEGVTEVGAADSALVRSWRESWSCAASTAALRLKRIKSFFRFAAEAGWIAESPAGALRPPTPDARPTMPLTRDEFRSMLKAAAAMAKERALLLLLRYSGLAIRDAATLALASLDGPLLNLRRAKSGELVICSLPGPVIGALEGIARPDRKHYFWTGTSRAATAAKYWRKRLRAVAAAAEVENFTPHRLRDTFAVELLIAGVAIQDVSTLLGHSSVRTTERYYAPWDTARRDRLTAILEEVHAQDPLLRELEADSGAQKKAEAVTAAPADGPARHLQGAERVC
jgi:site-specific recombinase XerD